MLVVKKQLQNCCVYAVDLGLALFEPEELKAKVMLSLQAQSDV